MGEVYGARDTRLDRSVALKIRAPTSIAKNCVRSTIVVPSADTAILQRPDARSRRHESAACSGSRLARV